MGPCVIIQMSADIRKAAGCLDLQHADEKKKRNKYRVKWQKGAKSSPRSLDSNGVRCYFVEEQQRKQYERTD